MKRTYKKSYKTKRGIRKTTSMTVKRYSKPRFRIPPKITLPQQYYNLTFAYRLNQGALAVGVIGFNLINIGSIYDPTGALSTRKYYGAAELFTLYKYATVLSAKVSLTALSPYTDTSPVVTMMTLQNEPSQDANINELPDFYETPIRKSGIQTFGHNLTKNLKNNNTIRLTYSAKKFFGRKFDNSDYDYASTSIANPPIAPYVGIYCISPDGTTSQSINFMLRISAIVRAWQPIALVNNG